MQRVWRLMWIHTQIVGICCLYPMYASLCLMLMFHKRVTRCTLSDVLVMPRASCVPDVPHAPRVPDVSGLVDVHFVHNIVMWYITVICISTFKKRYFVQASIQNGIHVVRMGHLDR